MKQFVVRIISFFNSIRSNIAFYPSILALSGSFFAFFMIYLEGYGISNYLLEHLPVLVINSGDTALTILGICIGGIISMMVFSFSMVMLLLNQAATNYSPRLLPGLISDTNQQVILGIFIATILYCIFVLFSIQPGEEEFQLPGFSVLLGVIFTIISIGTFIYFIHTISQNIQIPKILRRIYLTAEKRLGDIIEIENNAPGDFPNTADWYEYQAEKSGYFQNLSLDNLIDICRDNETQLHLLRIKGTYTIKGMPVFKSKRKLNQETKKEILSNINFATKELLADNYVLVFKQLTEVLVKAMSPAVNDPATALNAIDYLTDLFATRMQKRDNSVVSKEGIVYIKLTTVGFQQLIYNVMASIRTYCKHDIILIQRLAYMFLFLQSQQAVHDTYYQCIRREAEVLLRDARRVIENKQDQQKIEELSNMLGIEG